MKILLIQPNYVPNFGFLDELRLKLVFNPYITLQQIATVTPENHDVTILDEVFQRIDFSEKYDIIGITCCTPSAPRAYEIADEYRRRGVNVVLGGYHPSALPQEAKQHADSVVIGEAENSWPVLLHDLEKNRLQPFYHCTQSVDLESLPPLQRNMGQYGLFTARIEATRGCRYRCEFCSISNSEIGWHVFRKKPIENVIREIQSIPQKMLTFSDASLTLDVEYTKSLFKEMRHLNKKFICYGNAHVLNKDEELLKLSKDAGCFMWNIGFDSISQEALDSAGKKTNKVEDYASVVKKIKKYGMAVLGQFIFGFDTDTVDIFDLTVDAINNIGVDAPSVSILTPYPGTPLFTRLNNEGRILTKDWSKYTLCDVVFQPKQMSPGELFDGFTSVIKTFYNISNVMKRNLQSIKLGFTPLLGVIMENINEKGGYKKYFQEHDDEKRIDNRCSV
jgi:radical SAM superfamily enzyme YgiQ (UPF0313 family)